MYAQFNDTSIARLTDLSSIVKKLELIVQNIILLLAL